MALRSSRVVFEHNANVVPAGLATLKNGEQVP